MELAFRSDPTLAEPVYRQLAAHLQQLIEAGQLVPGQKLPPSRELAGSLALSRNTVNGAYQLLADGEWVQSHVGRGTFVAARPGAVVDGRLHAISRTAESEPRAFVWPGLFSARSQSMRTIANADLRTKVRFDFRSGKADPSGLPLRALRKFLGRALEDDLSDFANAGDPCGWGPLRQALASRLVARGIVCDVDNVLITSGAQQGLDLVSRVLLDPGDFVATECPGYFGADWTFSAAGAHAIPIPVDDEGLRTDELARVLRSRRLKLVYCTPAVQAPTGVTLSEARRAELLELADAHQVPILEDDYDGDMRLTEPIVPALKTLDVAGQVITIGTFSKAIFPTLRIGYVVGARRLIRQLSLAKLSADMGTSHLEQAALARWIDSGGLDRHVRATRREVGERIDAALEAIASEMPEGTSVRRPAGGHSLWIKLSEGMDKNALRSEAWANEISWAPAEAFLSGPEADGYLMLSVALLTPGEVREGIARIGEIARKLDRRARRARRSAA
jgi:DNA-binding transcriptional MocR family regulator